MGAAMSIEDEAVAGEGAAAGAEAEGVMQIRCSAFEISEVTAGVSYYMMVWVMMG